MAPCTMRWVIPGNEELPHSYLAFLSPDEYHQAHNETQVTINSKEKFQITTNHHKSILKTSRISGAITVTKPISED